MKILMVNSSRNWGGTEEILLSLSLELRSKGHHLGFFLREDSVTVRRFEEAGFLVWQGGRRGMSMHRHEPFGLHVVEGMAAGTPLVAYRAGGFPEIVEHGRNGYLAETQEELFQAILALLGNREKREEMGQSGRERALKLFTLERMVMDYEELYRSLKK